MSETAIREKEVPEYSNADKNDWTARCFSCETKGYCRSFYDHGLSRPYCGECHAHYSSCVHCGYNMPRGSGDLLDDKMEDGRYLCSSCNTSGIKKKMKTAEKNGVLYLMGAPVGSGTDECGPTALRRMRAVFKNSG